MGKNHLVLLLLLTVRISQSYFGIILDCDETFNYWEPLNYLIRGFGKQTWEYSPEYGIRSWSFLLPLTLSLKVINTVFTIDHMTLFWILRATILATTLCCEYTIYKQLKDKRWYLLFTLTSPGMSHAGIALLPSLFLMNCCSLLVSHSLAYLETAGLYNGYWCVLAMLVLTLTGWPFVAVLVVPFVVYVIIADPQWFKFLIRCSGMALLILLVITGIDSYLYGKFVMVPLNAVLYNVFNKDDTTGPNIFGVEPLSYYMWNLLLNFNIVVVLLCIGCVILPLYDWKNLVLVTPVWIWGAVFVSQPHKEERFMYPIYPFILVVASLTIDKLFKIMSLVLFKLIKYKKFARLVNVLIKIGFRFIVGTVSILRIVSLINNYSSPLNVYSHLPSEGNTVCVGREWYHFPNSFFLGDDQRLKYVKSGFNGILPGEFPEGQKNWAKGISQVPKNMNNKNLFEWDKVVSLGSCDYYVDIDQDVDLETGESLVMGNDDWEEVFCDKFIDIDNSYGLKRLIYLPDSIGFGHVEYYKYCILKRK